MGYTTDFEGILKINRSLTIKDLREFEKIRDKSSWGTDPNYPNSPESYCQWEITEDGEGLQWDGGEKFYDYVDWLEYLIKFFFAPRGYILTGQIEWNGEDKNDIGKITVLNNIVSTKEGKISYEKQEKLNQKQFFTMLDFLSRYGGFNDLGDKEMKDELWEDYQEEND